MPSHAQLRRFSVIAPRLPRYTSYPPADCFGTGVSAEDYAHWLARIPPGSEVSIYLHVPFCRRLCWFCAARTQGLPAGPAGASAADRLLSSYVAALLAEIAMLREALPEGIRARRILWGGGTPTVLAPADIARLAEALRAAVPLAEGGSFTVEVDPNDIDPARMDALASAGVTRVAVGLQDAHAEVQSLIGRAMPADTLAATVAGLRARGIAGLDMSLLYGLPRQDHARIEATTRMLLSFSPDRIAVLPYRHAPAMARRQSVIPIADLPAPDERAALFKTARQVLRQQGYVPLGIDHFAHPRDGLVQAARDGQLRRGFQGYDAPGTDMVLGLGASAISRLPQGYAQNYTRTTDYLRAVDSRGIATEKGHRLSEEDRLRGRMIEMLLCDFRIDSARLAAEGFGPSRRIAALLASLRESFPADLHPTWQTPGATGAPADDGTQGSPFILANTTQSNPRLLAALTVARPARPRVRAIARHLDRYTDR
jgi:oxygen-independent coproporphyrinogen-3 oxidase